MSSTSTSNSNSNSDEIVGLVRLYKRNVDKAYQTYLIDKNTGKPKLDRVSMDKFMGVNFGGWLKKQIEVRKLNEDDVYEYLFESL